MSDQEYARFVPEQEIVDSFARRGESVPPFIVFCPYETIDGIPGYWLPCQKGDDGARPISFRA